MPEPEGPHPATPTAPTVALVDDHPAVLAGLAAWYAAAEPPIEVVASGADPAVVLDGPGSRADVVVLDLQLSRTGPSYDALRQLAEDGRAVIVYTMLDSADVALTSLDLGAYTYLTKAEGDRHLVAATRAAAQNLPYTPPALAGAFGSDTRPGRPELAPREVDVLLEWFQCESKRMVAQSLGLSVHTVATYLDRVRIKYANAGRPAHTKALLVARALQDGLVALEEL
ncbi:DNA-binding response regulator [Streptomyces lonarensis]|uniref:Response regulator transcription factor n=3 Tax=Streptomyces TaxID=1883 RepID=A0A7X6D4L4_9ACTN|nr:response regulator transcription factor [Streptomyces lonarensis]NJQ08088.1 response regulator transcription factor [Streptomyces lonarensis]